MSSCTWFHFPEQLGSCFRWWNSYFSAILFARLLVGKDIRSISLRKLRTKLANQVALFLSDDNVHYQQSMMLTRALEEADVLFQQLSYPDENHGIVGLRKHFYHSLTNFLLNDCFGRNEVLKK